MSTEPSKYTLCTALKNANADDLAILWDNWSVDLLKEKGFSATYHTSYIDENPGDICTAYLFTNFHQLAYPDLKKIKFLISKQIDPNYIPKSGRDETFWNSCHKNISLRALESHELELIKHFMELKIYYPKSKDRLQFIVDSLEHLEKNTPSPNDNSVNFEAKLNSHKALRDFLQKKFSETQDSET